MARSVEFDEASQAEFIEAFDWYAKRSHGAAIGFASAVDVAIERIAENPDRFPTTFAGCRYCKVERFPFCVVFYSSERGLFVVAIAHLKRRPGYWRNRL